MEKVGKNMKKAEKEPKEAYEKSLKRHMKRAQEGI